MLHIKIIVVARTKTSFLRQGESFYLDRLRKYARMGWIEVSASELKKGRRSEDIVAKEGKSITRRLSPRDYVVALDRSGKTRDSIQLANHIGRLSLTHSRMAFIVGGHLGLSEQIFDRADEVLSLSRLTLTHEMSRLLLLEQLYRAFTILHGEKYHK